MPSGCSPPFPHLLVPREPRIAGPPGGRQVKSGGLSHLPCSENCPLHRPFRPRGTGAPLLPALPTAPVLPLGWMLVSTSLYQTLRKIPNLSVTPFLLARTCSVLLPSLGLLAVAALRGGRTWDSLPCWPRQRATRWSGKRPPPRTPEGASWGFRLS